MLDLRPIPGPCEPLIVQSARAALDAASWHPDAAEIGAALDVLSHAILRLTEIAPRMADAAARTAIECERHGMLGTLTDSVIDLRSALEDWAERWENQPDYLRAADAADFAIDAMKEDRL